MALTGIDRREVRSTDKYPCANSQCDRPGVGVESVYFHVGARASVAFYGFCVEHAPEVER